MITKFGMSKRIGFIGFAEGEFLKKHSDHTAKEIDEEIKKVIDECTEKTREIVKKYRKEIEKLSEALLARETLDLKAIIEILGERPYAPKSNFKAYLEYKDEKKVDNTGNIEVKQEKQEIIQINSDNN